MFVGNVDTKVERFCAILFSSFSKYNIELLLLIVRTITDVCKLNSDDSSENCRSDRHINAILLIFQRNDTVF